MGSTGCSPTGVAQQWEVADQGHKRPGQLRSICNFIVDIESIWGATETKVVWYDERSPACYDLKSVAPTVSGISTTQSMASSRQIIDDQCYVHFVTFVCQGRRRVLDHDQPKRIVLAALNSQLEGMRAKCVGFVIMPDHVHAALWLPEAGLLSRFMHGWKRISSYRIRRWYEEKDPAYFREVPPATHFWQPKYHSFEIYTTSKLEEKLGYMHLNPVRSNLVSHAVDWPWSSARWYEDRTSVGVPVAWIE